MKLLMLTLMLASPLFSADVRFTWLPTMTNVPGVEQTTTPQTLYGIQVFMDSDNAKTSEFAITLTVRIDGEIRVITGTVARSPKAEGVRYSSAWVSFFEQMPEVVAISVKAISARNVTAPIAGRDYSVE